MFSSTKPDRQEQVLCPEKNAEVHCELQEARCESESVLKALHDVTIMRGRMPKAEDLLSPPRRPKFQEQLFVCVSPWVKLALLQGASKFQARESDKDLQWHERRSEQREFDDSEPYVPFSCNTSGRSGWLEIR
jgi:hypothetical protein